jgi:hypothetical protein
MTITDALLEVEDLAFKMRNPIFELRKYAGIKGVAYVEYKDGRKSYLPLAMATYLQDKGTVKILEKATTVKELEEKIRGG